MTSILIKNPGMLSTIQDLGRFGYQNVGMSVAGAMDNFSLRCANILVGNDEGEAVIEFTLLGGEIEFDCEETVAITGADMNPSLNGLHIQMWESFKVKAGDVIKLSAAKTGLRTYLALGRTLDVPVIMKSKSTFLRGQIGGFEGRKLMPGDKIPLGEELVEKKRFKLPEKYIPKYLNEQEIRLVFGPQDDYFTEEGKETLISSEYKVSSDSDRMGYRLEGKPIDHNEKGADIISDGILFGSIQVPASGQPILMMADRQTTGGYTKIATVITPDLPKLAQMGPGSIIKFSSLSVEEAQKSYIEYEEIFKQIKLELNTAEDTNREKKFIISVNGKTFDVSITELD